MGAADAGTDDRIRERVPGNTLKLWLLLGASRWAVAALVLVVVGAGVAVVLWADPAPLRDAVGAADPVETLFQALVTAIITGVTLVVSINSLVLSQELGAVGDQRERMRGSLSFRADVADELDAAASPPEPSAFLRALVELSVERAERVQKAVAESDDALEARVDAYVADLRENGRRVGERLDGAEFGTFEVVLAALGFNYSAKIYEARRLRDAHADALGADGREALDALLDALELFGPAREHVKTLYFQWELVDLSRAVLYAAVPALVVSVGGLLALDNLGSVPGSTLGVANLGWVVLAATLVALAPFAVLLSYVLRIATVAKRTLAIGPFVLRETGRSEGVDWSEDDD